MGIFYRENAKDYFYGSIWPDVIASIGTWGLILMMIVTKDPKHKTILFFLAAIVLAGSQIYKAVDRKMKEFVNWESCIDDDMERHKKRAIEKLGIEESQVNMIDPILVSGPYFDYRDNLHNAEHSESRFLKTIIKFLPFVYGIKLIIDRKLYDPRLIIRLDGGTIKYSLVTQHLFFFSDEQIFIYEVKYDIVNGQIYEENTYDYFYRDVDCVETGAKAESIISGNKMEMRLFEYFKVIVYSGTSTYAVTEGRAGILENQVMAMRALLRERKLRE